MPWFPFRFGRLAETNMREPILRTCLEGVALPGQLD